VKECEPPLKHANVLLFCQLGVELKQLGLSAIPKAYKEAASGDVRPDEIMVRDGCIKRDQSNAVSSMVVEDLAALEVINEDTVIRELEERYRRGLFHSFVGDVLLVLTPPQNINENHEMFSMKRHAKHVSKARCDNSPHMFSVADSALQVSRDSLAQFFSMSLSENQDGS